MPLDFPGLDNTYTRDLIMAGFTFRVTGGVTGQRPVPSADPLDLSPLLLKEDPTESLIDAEAYGETEGLLFLRKHDAVDDVHAANTRPVIQLLNPFGDHEPRTEGTGNLKYCLYTNGAQEFAPGPSNRIFMSPISTFRTSSHALVFSGLREPTHTPAQIANASIDMMYVAGIRLPGVGNVTGEGIIPCPVTEGGAAAPKEKFGAAGSFGFQSRWHSSIELNSAGGVTITSGNIIPAGAFLMAVGYDITVRGHTDGADVFTIGIAGDLSRFLADGNTYSYDDDVVFDVDNPFRHYAANTELVVTLDDNLQGGQFFSIRLWTCYLTFMGGLLVLPDD